MDPTGGKIQLYCIHGDVRMYLSIQMTLTVDEETRVMTVGIAPRLPNPVFLGWDSPEFNQVLHFTTCHDLPEQMALEGQPPEGENEVSRGRESQDDPPTPPQVLSEPWKAAPE